MLNEKERQEVILQKEELESLLKNEVRQPQYLVHENSVRIVCFDPLRFITARDLDDQTLSKLDDEITHINCYKYPTHVRDWVFRILSRAAKYQMLPRTEIEFMLKCAFSSLDKMEYALKVANELWEDGFNSIDDLLGPILDRELDFLVNGMGWLEGDDSMYKLSKLGKIADEVISGTDPVVEMY